MHTKENTKPRFYLLDAIRGLALMQMILYHGTFDLVYIFGKRIDWYISTPGYLWQQSICWTFIFLSGMCWSFSKNNKKRGLIIFSMAMILTIVTGLFMPEMVVKFGILHFIGLAMLLFSYIEPVLKKIHPVFGVGGCAFLFILTRNINTGYLGFEQYNWLPLPSWLYENSLLFPIGFPERSFYSSDYFSMLPWIFLYAAGYFMWQLIKNNHSIKSILCFRIPFLSLLGSKTLPIYMAHQPIILAVLSILFR